MWDVDCSIRCYLHVQACLHISLTSFLIGCHRSEFHDTDGSETRWRFFLATDGVASQGNTRKQAAAILIPLRQAAVIEVAGGGGGGRKTETFVG
jgi:hypothetical protein